MGSFEDHLLGGTVDVPAGNVKRLRKACEGLVGIGTATNPVTIRLAAGTYTLDRYLTVPNYCKIIGQGRDSTIIQRTVGLVNTAFGTVSTLFCDPVLDLSGSQSVTLENLSVIHSGTAGTSQSSTGTSPCAILTGGAKRFKMNNVRLEGSWAGWLDKTDTFDNTFSKPIPDDVMGNEDYQYRLDNCIVIGHSANGVRQVARHEVYANGCIFICDIGASDVLQTSTHPNGFDHWEYTVGYYKSCEFIMRCAQTLTLSSATEVVAAFVIRDTAITDTIAYCDDCTFTLDLSEGDLNSASSGGASVYVSGNLASGGILYNYNVFNANGCHFRYGTGSSVTSAPYICGLYFEAQGGVSTAIEGRLKNCKFEDFEGAGGTRRRDIVIPGRLGNVQAKSLVVENCNIQDYDYRNITGSPVYTHANFMTEPNTMNRQSGSVTFATAATAAATLALNYTASAGVNDYWVGLEPSANETFWVSAKTNSGFTVNSSNATSTAVIKYVVRR